jgi:L-threonylcarbamoyladenylate synthase
MPRIIRVPPDNPSCEKLYAAAEILRSGGIVAYPTETFYGLGADALNQDAVKKIFAIKKRRFSQPLLILVPNREVIPDYVKEVPDAAHCLMDAFWPGSLTLIFAAAPQLPQGLCANTGTIAIRLSPHPVARALVETFGGAITSTSANISGQDSPAKAEQVLSQLDKNVDLVIDGGSTAGKQPSTIVDITATPPRLVRQGAIPFAEVRRYF